MIVVVEMMEVLLKLITLHKINQKQLLHQHQLLEEEIISQNNNQILVVEKVNKVLGEDNKVLDKIIKVKEEEILVANHKKNHHHHLDLIHLIKAFHTMIQMKIRKKKKKKHYHFMIYKDNQNKITNKNHKEIL